VDNRDFHDLAHSLVGQDVEVITVHGSFTGTLLSVGSNFITMRTRIRGRLVRLLIRLALIVALFRLAGRTGGSYVWTPSRHAQDEDDALSNFPIIDDDPPEDRRTGRRTNRRTGRRTNRRSERRTNRRSF
jgi:hypothetical protein